MNVAVLIITHHEIGRALVNALLATYGDRLPLPLETVEVQYDADPDQLLTQLTQIITQLDQGEGVLILTDLFGSTPSNIAHALQKNGHAKVVAGLNLPMLIRVMNYPHLNLSELTEKAMKGGQAGIIESA